MSRRPRPRTDSLGRFLRADGTPAQAPDPSTRQKRRPAEFKHYRVDEVLTDEQRREYERLLASPKTTVAHLQQWLRDRGHPVCRSAIGRHRRSFASELRSVRECSRMAAAFCEIARESGGGNNGTLAEAAHARFEMMLLQHLLGMKNAPQMPPEEWQAMAKLTQSAVTTRRSVEQMRAEFRRKAEAASAEVEKLVPKATGKDVVARMREILGV